MRRIHFIALSVAFSFCLKAEVTTRDFYDAIRLNDLARLQSYVTNGTIVNLRDARGTTPLMQAAAVGSIEAMRLLLKAGADVNAKNGLDSSALVYCAMDRQKAKLLLDAGAEVNVRTKLGRTPLLMAAGSPGNSELVKMLLAKGADTSLADVRGNTALVEAARVNDLESVRLLIDHKVDINAGDFGGITALGHAAGHSNLEMVRLLLAKGAQVNASLKREIKVKNGLIAVSNLTPLMTSVTHGSIEILKTLLDAGADVKAKDVRGLTALMLAVCSDTANPQIVRLLLDHGSDLNAKSTTGETALDWAKKFNHPAIVPLLGGQVSQNKAVLQPAGSVNTDVRKALERSIPLLESTSTEYFKQSGCVGCHHQDLIGGAVSAAARKGLPVNHAGRQEQLKIVKGEMLGAREALLQEVFISVDGHAYALSMMADQEYPGDEITDAMVSLIASQQTASGGWNEFPVVRPPLESSPIVAGALAARAMSRYAIPARKAEFEARVVSARNWLSTAKAHAAYEHSYRLLGLQWSGAARGAIDKAIAEVRRQQRPDGGFAQTEYLASDAYATASALWALHEAGVPAKDPAYQRGVRFLLANQREDGSWFVASRTPKVQPYFQSGFPHNHDQWISAAATALSVKVLTEAVEPGRLTASVQ